MPTIRKPAPDPLRLALAPETIDVLLHGWGAPNSDYSTDPHTDPFQAFTLNVAAVWHEHRTALCQAWERLELPGEPWGRRFDQVPAGPAHTQESDHV